jgi:hypothetical protein
VYPAQVAALVTHEFPFKLTEHDVSNVWQVENVRLLSTTVFLAQSNVQAVVAVATFVLVHPNLYNSQSALVPLNVVHAPVAKALLARHILLLVHMQSSLAAEIVLTHCDYAV